MFKRRFNLVNSAYKFCKISTKFYDITKKRFNLFNSAYKFRKISTNVYFIKQIRQNISKILWYLQMRRKTYFHTIWTIFWAISDVLAIFFGNFKSIFFQNLSIPVKFLFHNSEKPNHRHEKNNLFRN